MWPFQVSNEEETSIDSDNGLAPNRLQAIIWTNDVLGYWQIYASGGFDELNAFGKYRPALTHWGRVTHIYVDNLIIIGSDDGLLPGRRQTII